MLKFHFDRIIFAERNTRITAGQYYHKLEYLSSKDSIL